MSEYISIIGSREYDSLVELNTHMYSIAMNMPSVRFDVVNIESDADKLLVYFCVKLNHHTLEALINFCEIELGLTI